MDEHDQVITCIGGANIDRKAVSKEAIRYYSSNPVVMSESFGGVARNVAENLAQLGSRVSFLSVVGNDKEGLSLLDDAKRKGIDASLTEVVSSCRTGTYTALLDVDGEMVISLADMDIYDQLTPAIIEDKWASIASSQAVFIDTNIPDETIAYTMRRCRQDNIFLCVDPVSSLKSRKLPQDLTGVKVILPNLEEAEELSGMKVSVAGDYRVVADAIKDRGVENVVITLGSEGVFYSSGNDSGQLMPYEVEIVDVTGAGDALTAGVLASMIYEFDLKEACRYGLVAAAFTLRTGYSVARDLSFDSIRSEINVNN